MSEAVAQADLEPIPPDHQRTPLGQQPWWPAVVWVACAAVALLTNAAAFPGRDFIWFDRALVADNSLLNSLGGLQMAWAGLAEPSRYLLPQYAPLAQTLFFIERMAFGEWVVGYRIVSALLHATTGFMLWQLLRRLHVPGAVAATLLFVAHPLTIESVSLLSERRNVLAGLLGVSSLFLMLRAAGTIAPTTSRFKALPDDPTRLYAMSAVTFVLALFANATLVAALPLVGLLIVWWRRGRADVTLAAVAVGLLVAGVMMAGLSAHVEKVRSGALPATWNRGTTSATELAVRTQIAGRAVAFYVAKLVAPYSLTVDYTRWRTPAEAELYKPFVDDENVSTQRVARRRADITPGDPLDWIPPLSVVAVLVAMYAASGRIGRGPFVATAAFVLVLLPSLGFIDLGWMRYSFVADRAAYLAVAAFFAGIAAVAAPILSSPAQRPSAIASVAILLVVYAILAFNVAKRYRATEGFWLANANANPRSWLSRYALGRHLLGRDVIGAQQAVNGARTLRPYEPASVLLVGQLYARLGQLRDAMDRFNWTIQNFPEYAPGYAAAAEVYYAQAERARTNPNLWGLALQHYTQATAFDPLDARSWLRRGQTDFEIARRLETNDPKITELLDDAAVSFNEAVQTRPYDPDQLVAVSRTLIAMGKLSDAGNLLQTARTIDPSRADVVVLIADGNLMAGEATAAETALRAAMALEPKLVEARLKLGTLLQSQGRWDEARQILESVLELDPANADAQSRIKAVDASAATQPSATRPTATQPAAPAP